MQLLKFVRQSAEGGTLPFSCERQQSVTVTCFEFGRIPWECEKERMESCKQGWTKVTNKPPTLSKEQEWVRYPSNRAFPSVAQGVDSVS